MQTMKSKAKTKTNSYMPLPNYPDQHTRLNFTRIMHNCQLNIRSCHDPDCDYGRQSLTLAMQNFSIWTSFPQISIEMGWEMGNIFGMYICYSPALIDPCWEKLPEVLSTTLGRRPRKVLRPRAQFLPIRIDQGR